MCSNFEKLRSCVLANKVSFEVGSPASSETIKKAEELLDTKFPKSLIDYLSTWGTLAIGPLEFYGIPEDSLELRRIPDGVWFTRQKRLQLGLPEKFFVLFNSEGDEYHCIDLNTGEVKIWNTAEQSITGTKATDVFQYIMMEVADFI